MGAGLAGRPPCLPHSQVLMGAGLAVTPEPSNITFTWEPSPYSPRNLAVHMAQSAQSRSLSHGNRPSHIFQA